MEEKTSIAVELNLCFDNDFDVYTISDRLNLSCDKCKRRNETRINPITHKQNCGYWTIVSKLNTLHLEDVEKILINRIKPKLNEIKQIVEQNGGFVGICVVPDIENHNIPSLRFNREFLSIVEELHAIIDFDIYID